MGPLDKLGLRKSPPDQSVWLESQLKRLKEHDGSPEIAAEIGN